MLLDIHIPCKALAFSFYLLSCCANSSKNQTKYSFYQQMQFLICSAFHFLVATVIKYLNSRNIKLKFIFFCWMELKYESRVDLIAFGRIFIKFLYLKRTESYETKANPCNNRICHPSQLTVNTACPIRAFLIWSVDLVLNLTQSYAFRIFPNMNLNLQKTCWFWSDCEKRWE